MRIVQMTPAEWAVVKDNPIQRDTQKRAEKAARGHLRNASTSQAVVHAAVLVDGRLVKLDGHTRAHLWSEGLLKPPESVHVVLHEGCTIGDAIELYKQFDSAAACENATDRFSGALRLHGISAGSSAILKGGVTSALRVINSTRSIYDLVGDWKLELQMIDELGASNEVFPSPVICAALLTLRKHGRKALEFWRLYAAGLGTRIDGMSDGVDELTRIVDTLRASKQLARGGCAVIYSQAGRAVSCCERWMRGKTYSAGARHTDLRAYMASLPEGQP